MNLRQERLAEVIREYVSEDVMLYEQMHEHSFGVITIVSVTVSPDYSYADISVMSQTDTGALPKFLSHTESITRKRIAKDYKLWKVPRIRFRISEKEKKTGDILSLIHSLDTQYGLSREYKE